MTESISRRRFLKNGFLVLAVASTPGAMTLMNLSPAYAKGDANFKPHAFLEIAPDGGVTVWVGQTNLGQGTHTGLGMIIADELDADWKDVTVRMALASDAFRDPLWGVQLTAGSTSIRNRWDQLRTVGASARLMLIEAAAAKWGVNAKECSASKGKVIGPGGKSIGYGELTEAAAKLEVPENPPFKKRNEYDIMGTYKQRVDMEDKIHGRTIFGLDIQFPDMLITVMARPPRFGAKPESYNEKAALAIKGVEKVLPYQDKVAVLATTTYAALKGRDALAVKWSKGSHPNLSDETIAELFKQKMAKPGAIAEDIGDTEKMLKEAATTLEASYSVPWVAHAQLEPENCTAKVEKDRCLIWAPTQGQTAGLETASKVTGLPMDKIELVTTYCGGGFGRRIEEDYITEAVTLAKETGRTVKVMWTREDDFADDVLRPASHCEIKAGLDAEGNLTAWRHKLASQSIFARVQPDGVKDGVDPSSLQGLPDMPYKLPNRLIEYVLIELPMRVGWFRSIAYSYNAFFVEGFLDELAHKANRDPLEFRLSLLEKDSREYKALTTLADKGGWKKPVPKGQGRGIAMTSCFESVAAHMADVSVDPDTGFITVHKIVALVDCGVSVYPDAVKAQMEGGTVIGMSLALNEAMQFADGGVNTYNFSSYPLLSMTQVPEIEVILADSGAKAGGIGEPSIPSVAPAIANAVFAATGVRLRDLPFKTSALKKA